MRHNIISSIEELDSLQGSFDSLSANSIEQNINYEITALKSLLTNFEYVNWFVFCIWRDELLVGVFPMQRVKRIPIPVFQCTLLFENHLMSCIPLMHKNYYEDVINEFWRWFNRGNRPKLLHIPELLSSSELGRLWLERGKCAGSKVKLSVRHCRAVANIKSIDFDTYCSSHLSARLKRVNRQNIKKMMGMGGYSAETITVASDDLMAGLDLLKFVEGSGWKRDNGSAIAVNPNLEMYIREIALYAAKNQRVILTTSKIGEIPAGAFFGLINDNKLFIYKIGYNQVFSKYSIGILTLISLIEHMINDGTVEVIDSCAANDIEIYNRCFPLREEWCQYHIASSHWISKLILWAVFKSRKMRVLIKQKIKS